MKATKKALALVLAVISVLFAFGCGNTGTGNGAKTVIKVTSYLGGFGTDWLDEAAERFEAANKNIKLNISHTKNTNVSTISSSAQDLYFVNDGDLPPTLAQKGLVADINDIVMEKFDTRNGEPISIDDKIEETYKCMLKGNTKSGESHYFALPYATFASGISYDIDFFTKYNCYIAAEGEDAYAYSAYGTTVNFVTSATTKKSAGQDGIEGTYDDGLPVSMQEFLVLCDYIKAECNASPIHYAGNQKAYLNGLINALEISIGGKDYANSMLNFTGTVECVQMEKVYNEWQVQTEQENLFSGSVSGVQVPKVYDAELSDAKAYLTTQTSARYYANAFLYTLYKEGYFSDKCLQTSSTNLEGQAEFLKSGYGNMETFAMFIEGSYWYTEAVENEMTSAYDTVTNIGWMPMPITVSADESTEGKQSVIVSEGGSFCFINANTEKNKPEVLAAAKKFLQFLYSDDELSKYTGSTGCYKRAINYEVKAEDMAKVSSFSKNVMQAFEASHVVQFASSNKTFLANSTNLWGSVSRKVMPEIRENANSTGTTHYSSIMLSFTEQFGFEKVYNSTVLDEKDFLTK